jgi:23S rRNA pseudouridine1911/1915/1917 synthase
MTRRLPDPDREVEVGQEWAGERVDRALAHMLGVPRSRLEAWFRQGQVRLGAKPLRPSYRLEGGERLSLPPGDPLPPPWEGPPVAQSLPLPVVYEDADILVVDKPAGMVVHPAAGHAQGTVVNALVGQGVSLAPGSEAARPGVVHRLDKDTSGLLVVAKTAQARARLAQALARHEVRRVYHAVVRGQPPVDRGRVEAPIGRDPHHPLRFAVRPDGRPSVTHFRVLERHRHGCLVELSLDTGRTHQIRVHMAFLGCPVAGDPLYGRAPDRNHGPGQLLHAVRLGLPHPRSGQWMEWESPWPPRMQKAIERLRADLDPVPGPCPSPHGRKAQEDG